MNNNPTPSDLADQALATLAAALDAGKSDALTAYLKVMARFHHYSWGNSLLIETQRPNARQVAGFHAWLKLGRHVRKGEKGIAILAPVIGKTKAASDSAESQENKPTETPSETKRLRGFKTAWVFDIGQTEGTDLPEFAEVQGDPQDNLERLKAFAIAQPIAVEYDASIAPAMGLSSGGCIRLLPDMPPAKEFATLAHEIAHELLHKKERRGQTNKTVRETEAEAVSFVVCQAIGLDVNSASADYISLYHGDSATLAASLHFIQSTANTILTALSTSKGKETSCLNN
jgi:antirestriction protein ArdC